jgi:hypothetical protein
MANPDTLTAGPVHWFSDWPVEEVPRYAEGVYTVWDRTGRFMYVGMAGRGMAASNIRALESERGRPRGLWDRLNSHASGRRSGDPFCVYVADRLVLPSLSPDQIEAVGAGSLSLDVIIQEHIRSQLGFRFLVVKDGTTALAIEREVQSGSLTVGRPLLNPR